MVDLVLTSAAWQLRISPVKVKRIALTDFAESGPAKELADAYGYAPEKIAATVKETLGK